MTSDEVEKNAIKLYRLNLEFLEKDDNALFQRIKLFEAASELGELKSIYELEYKDDLYFDALIKENNSYYYNTNSFEYSKMITKKINFNLDNNAFKSFYEDRYDDNYALTSINNPHITSVEAGNAPIIHYVNTNKPKDEISSKLFNYFIFGVGLGFHIPMVFEKVKANSYYIIEPSLELFRLSLFTTDYKSLSLQSKIVFSIGETREVFLDKVGKYLTYYSFYTHYIKFLMFSKNCDYYVGMIQEVLSSQAHHSFNYWRTLEITKRTFQYLKEEYNFINIFEKQKLELFRDKKILILAAGPSLGKNIEFVKKNQNKFLIVAILSILPILEEHNIKADIVTYFDDYEAEVMKMLSTVKDKKILSEPIFLSGAQICNTLMKTFPKENIFLFQTSVMVKHKFGQISSSSIGEVTYYLTLSFGANNVYLLGLDMAMDPESGASHSSSYYDPLTAHLNKKQSLDKFTARGNHIKIRGNFLREVTSLAVFNRSIKTMNEISILFAIKEEKSIYNLSNGAYFNDIKPLKIDEIDLTKDTVLNKEELSTKIKEIFNDNSENFLSKNDFDNNRRKYIAAIALQDVLKNDLLGVKHGNIRNFHIAINKITNLVSDFESDCSELNRILLNYFKFNIPYIYSFIYLKNINNPKKHIKQINKTLFIQVNKLITEYINILPKEVKEL